MRISRNFTVEDWRALTLRSENDWDFGVRIFEDRIETRYLEHIRVLLERKTSGFAVLSLDSALIETFEQFRRGTAKTPNRMVGDYFEAFLTQTRFKDHFDPVRARLFYTTIRCGLLHQAEADGGSRIKRGKRLPLVSLSADASGIVINVQAFHSELEGYFRDFAAILRSPGSIDEREKFRRKMNYIARSEHRSGSAEMF